MKNLILLINLASLLLIVGLLDLINFDNSFYFFLNQVLRINEFAYYDISFWKILEITGVFIATYIPFHILRKEQEANERKTKLEHKPVFESSQIRFGLFSTNIKLDLQNIGSGPALFVRLSFIRNYVDKPTQPILRFNEPHSRDLAVMNTPSSKFFFDSGAFTRFITDSERGGELASNVENYNNINNRDELNNLLRSKVGKTYFIYIHCLDVLGNKLIYKIKYILELENDCCRDDPEFLLKRMEIKEVTNK